ncbi:Protein CutA [Trichinella spiralis]|uniref:Protein CutA n=1 Tax=Trichinella spiralis TaxID=6334 RepID=A0ABR3KMI5_TRISP
MQLSAIYDFISDHYIEIGAGVVALLGIGWAVRRRTAMPPDRDNPDSFTIVYSTVPSMEVGKDIARAILNRNDAACINLIPNVVSMFNWGGGIDESEEVVLIIKTTKKQFRKINATIVERHPYSVPAILEIPVENGNSKFLSWIHNTTFTSAAD